jgi:trimeric autotransporter adhesin
MTRPGWRGALLLTVVLALGGVSVAAALPDDPVAPAADEPSRTARPVETAPAPAIPTGPAVRGTGVAGAFPVGTTRYAVPEDAVHVSPDGSDNGRGTPASPWRTVARAVGAARNGATVVLREGAYPESVTIPAGKRLTLQSYPGEEVWFDGSREVTGWTPDGAAWRLDGWTVRFDASPTYTPGAPDGRLPGWAFVNPDHPLAAHPDMVFVDGVPQRQVGSRAAVTPGSFFVDQAGDRLWLGTEPTGHSVRASTLSVGLTVEGAGSVVRGIGIRRYATPVPEKGALRSLAPGVTIENVVVSDNATQGIYVGGRDLGVRNTLRQVTAERNGMLGIESSYSDGLVLDRARVVGNNTERFNQAPVSGGVKIGRARDIRVTGSVVADNLGTGLWFDESVHGVTAAGNDLLRNTGHGLSFEISSQAVIADNLVAGNGDSGLKINNAARIEIWNNTVVDNGGRQLWVVQDARVAADVSLPGHDPRQPLPDATVTWLLGPVTIANNVVGGRTAATCLLCIQDTALRRTPEEIGLVVDGNLWVRPAAPVDLATWPGGGTFSTLAAFTASTGQNAHGAELPAGARVLDAGYRLTPDAVAAAPDAARPVPSWVAVLSGLSDPVASLGVQRG